MCFLTRPYSLSLSLSLLSFHLLKALEDDENKGPADFLEAEEGMQFNYDGRALEMYEHVQKVSECDVCLLGMIMILADDEDL